MMTRDSKIRLCILLLVLNLCFIWGNSLLPAEVSQAFSDAVQEVLESFREEEALAPSGSGLLRKVAHFTEFTLLGLLLRWLLALLQKPYRYALPLGMAAACVDETIQFFVPGRSPGLLDVGIDSCGVLTGIILLQIGYFILKRKQPTQSGGYSK